MLALSQILNVFDDQSIPCYFQFYLLYIKVFKVSTRYFHCSYRAYSIIIWSTIKFINSAYTTCYCTLYFICRCRCCCWRIKYFYYSSILPIITIIISKTMCIKTSTTWWSAWWLLYKCATTENSKEIYSISVTIINWTLD